MKRWYVVHTHLRDEDKAMKHLCEQGFDAYLPRYRTTRRHARKTETVLSPLFPRYLFVHIDLNVDRWRAVNSTRGVSYLMQQNDQPVAVPRGVVEALRVQSDFQDVVPLSSLVLFGRGDRVKVTDGAFAGQLGVYEKMASSERVQLLLRLLGREVRVSVPIHAVSAA